MACSSCPSQKGNWEDVAIIGLAVDLPSADSAESFWDMTVKGRCAAGDFPADRVNHEAWHDNRGSVPGTIRPKKGHFIKHDVAAFDAPFFSISADEAAAMDPQQRGLLEVTYKALENAGISLDKISGSNTAVFTGSFTADYTLLNAKDPERVANYTSTGLSGALLSNRISSFFNLTGPSITIDTACSSSLIAFDQACKTVSRGEASMGIVTGCNLILALDVTLGLSRMGFLSPDGICHSFDERANGYSRGEGFAALIIKPISQAVRDGDAIRAVVRSTKSNQNGFTALAQPSKDAQIRLIRETYHQARLNLAETRYVEAHGTGTATGDPIEATAIGETFGCHRSPDSPVFIGTAKANVGHTEGASGIVGIIKATLVLEKGIIPPIANFEKLNPAIDAEFYNMKFPETCLPWPDDEIRRASVSSSGFGGANAHAVLEDAFHYLQEYDPESSRYYTASNHASVDRPNGLTNGVNGASVKSLHSSRPQLFCWSAADPDTLVRLLDLFRTHLDEAIAHPDSQSGYHESLAYTLGERRSLLPWTSYAVSDSLPSLVDALESMPPPQKMQSNPKLGFVFTGQGAQWLRMGNDLLVYSVFRHSVEQAEKYLRTLGCPWSLLDDVFNNEESNIDIDDPRYAQPICTVLQIGLVDLLRSFNILPSGTIGHSSGEIAAAYAAGAISCRAAWKLAYFRGTLSSNLEQSGEISGGMIAVGTSQQAVQSYIDTASELSTSGFLCVACNNSPSSVTVSGDRTQIKLLKELLDQDKIFNRILAVPLAYHSPQMKSITATYIESLGSIEPGRHETEAVPMISTVTGELITADALRDPRYWAKNLSSPVKFAEALQHWFRDKPAVTSKKLDLSHRRAARITDILEIGPHATLKGPILQTLDSVSQKRKIRYASCLIRHKPAISTLMEVAGGVHSSLSPVNISQVNAITGSASRRTQVLTSLPSYPFNHSSTYWRESRISKNMRLRNYGYSPFLGVPVPDWNDAEPRWRHFLNCSSPHTAWIRDHKINGDVLFPAAGMLVMALEAVLKTIKDTKRPLEALEFRNVEFLAGLAVPDDEDGVEIGIRLGDLANSSSRLDSGFEFSIHAHHREGINRICLGSIQPIFAGDVAVSTSNAKESQEAANIAASKLDDALRRSTKESTGSSLYTRLYKLGFQFGRSFRRIEHVVWENAGEAIGNISIYDDNLGRPTVIHPATLDGVIQVMIPAATKAGNIKTPVMVPTRIDRLWIKTDSSLLTPSAQVKTLATLKSATRRTQEFDTYTFDSSGSLNIQFDGIQATTIAASEVSNSNTHEHARQLCFDIVSEPDISLMDRDQIQEILNSQKPTGPEPVGIWNDIEEFVRAVMRQALEELDELNIPAEPPHLRKQWNWVEQKSLQAHSSTALTTDCYQRLERHGKIGPLYANFGRHFNDILQGKVDALEFLSRDNFLRDYYDFHNSTSKFLDPLRYYLKLLSHKNPSLRIMEVGAGTGSTTHQLMSILSTSTSYGYHARYSKYDFTDISPSFLNLARETFSKYPKMNFGVFDVEKDAAEQGYDEYSYDVIVAANVVHATKSLESTLRALRTLLKRDGKLILIEMIESDTVSAPAMFGCLPGWWSSVDDYRSMGPCISEKKWDSILRLSDFSGTDIVLHDYDAIHSVNCMISTAVERNPEAIGDTKYPVRIVTGFNDRGTEDPLLTVLVREACEHEKIGAFADAVQDKALHDSLVVIVYHRLWPMLDHLTDEEYRQLNTTLLKAKAILCINERSNSKDDCPKETMMIGIARTLRLERPGLVFAIASIDPQQEDVTRLITQALQNTRKGISTGVYEPELYQKTTLLEIPRISEDDTLNQLVHTATSRTPCDVEFGLKDLQLKIQSPGLLSSLFFEEKATNLTELEDDEVELEVKAIGINFRDVLLALGTIPGETFGGECSGIISRAGRSCSLKPGERVVVGYGDPFCRTIRCQEYLALQIPDSMTYPEAAAIPINFVTAYRALVEVANLTKGETILIHSGAGGTGQAAIQVAQYCGATVFTTVSSDSKKQLLMDLYKIPAEQILYSRDTSFAKGIMRLTNGQGVDVVLNSLAGQGLLASWECIAPYGRFIEIGKKDIASRHSLPMLQFARNVMFAAVDIAAMGIERPKMVSEILGKLLKLFKTGTLHSVTPLKTFPISQVEQALRYLQIGTNTGKAVIEVDPQTKVPSIVEHTQPWRFDTHATYVVSGGLGGIGRRVVQWMITKGARHFLLLSRSGAKSKSAKAFINATKTAGIDVRAPSCDVSDPVALQKVLDSYKQTMPPIKGCIQSSTDIAFEKMTPQEWRESLLPKVSGSWNLHQYLPRGMDFFIFFSSVTGVIGSQSQANYAAGNTFQDSLAHFRRSQGEAAMSINICVIESVGLLAEHRELSDQITNTKHIMPMSENELLAILDQYCHNIHGSPSSPDPRPIQVVTGLTLPARVKAMGAQAPAWMRQPMFLPLYETTDPSISETAEIGHQTNGDRGSLLDVSAILGNAGSSVQDVASEITTVLQKMLSKFLSLDSSDLDVAKPLQTYGVDSLIGMELRSWVLNVLKVEVSVFEILGGESTESLALLIAKKILDGSPGSNEEAAKQPGLSG
ncbi:putative polyketide synthase [Nemania sp. FL0916]|nr:putative polyketide synthase [Nemania sp. FL0916]